MGKTNQLGTGEAIVGGRPFRGGWPSTSATPPSGVRRPDLTLDDPRGPSTSPAPCFVRSQPSSPRASNVEGAERSTERWEGRVVDGGVKTRGGSGRKTPIVRHRNRRRRRPRHWHSMARRPARFAGPQFPVGEVTVTVQRPPAATCAARRFLVAHGELSEEWWQSHQRLIRVHDPVRDVQQTC